MRRLRPIVVWLSAALGTALLVGAPPFRGLVPHAVAQDGDDGGGDEKKKKKQTPEELELIAIGKEFAAKDSDALIARVPKKTGKVRLLLGRFDERYGRDQAKKVLDEWFESREITKVKLKSSIDNVGEFELKLRRKGKEQEVELVLQIKIAKDGDAFVLKSVEVQNE